MKQTDKALDKNRPGQEQGLSFWQCFARNRLYSRDLPGLRPYLYIIPFFLAYLVLDFSLRFTYRGVVHSVFLVHSSTPESKSLPSGIAPTSAKLLTEADFS